MKTDLKLYQYKWLKTTRLAIKVYIIFIGLISRKKIPLSKKRTDTFALKQ